MGASVREIFARLLAALLHARRPTDSFTKVPYGYSDVISGLVGGIFLLSGLLAAIIAAPLFYRVLIHYLVKTAKAVLRILSIACICFILLVGQTPWLSIEVIAKQKASCIAKPNNFAGIYSVLVAISSVSFILLPVGLELGVEITRNAEAKTAILWSGVNTVSVIWVIGATFSSSRSFSRSFSMHT